MTTTSSSFTKQKQNVRIQSPFARAYWASVTRCVARLDGSGEVVHADGRVERFDAKGRPVNSRHAAIAGTGWSHNEDISYHAQAA